MDRELGPSFKRPRLSEICNSKRLIIFGINSMKIAQENPCPNQIRIVSGILYLSFIKDREYVYLSPLPSPKHIKSYVSSRVVVPYSDALAFYIKDLKEEIPNLYPVKLKFYYELDQLLPKILESSDTLLLLPDPVIIDTRSKAILYFWLKRYPKVKVINLSGHNLKHPGLINMEMFLPKIIKRLEELYFKEELERGKIYYVEY